MANRTRHIILTIAILATALLTFSSCVKMRTGLIAWGSKVSISLGPCGDFLTKAGEDPVAVRTIDIPGEDATDGLFITEYVSYNTDGIPGYLPTKGAVTTTGSINSDGEEFKIDAYLSADIASMTDAEVSDKNNFHFIDGKTVICDGSEWNWNGIDAPLWRNKVATTFWSYYPVEVAGRTLTLPADLAGNDDQAKLSFTYSLPASCTGTPYIDAQNQQDLLFAYNNKTYTGEDNTVNIHFYHALAAIRFDVTEIAGVKIESIEIQGIKSSGKCDVTAPLAINKFIWTNQSDVRSFKQDFDIDTDFTLNSKNRNTQPDGSEKVFFMIPQTLTSAAELVVTFTRDGSSEPVTRSIFISEDSQTHQWEAGKYYTYAIGKHELDLEITTPDVVDAHFGNAILRFSKKLPSSYAVDGDASWLRFAKPASATEFAAYPGDANTIGISALMTELMGSGSKTHFYETENYYYAQAFIDEYYLEGQSLSNFINKPDRTFTLTIGSGSTIATSAKKSSATLSQHSIKSPYSLSTTNTNPFGVETIEESDASAASPCSDRNLGRSTAWRQPTLQEYYNIWYGYNTLVSNSWTPLSDNPYSTSNTGSYARYDGVASTWGALSGTGKVRCIRNLGTGATPDPMYTISGQIVTMQNLGSGSLRTAVQSSEYDPHTLTDAANMLPAKFKVAIENMKYKYPEDQDPGFTTITGFQVNIVMLGDATMPAITYSGKNVTLRGGTFRITNHDPDIYYTYSSSHSSGNSGTITSSIVNISKDGLVTYDMDIQGWSSQNSGNGWGIQANYMYKDGNYVPMGKPGILYLCRANKAQTIGGTDGHNPGVVVSESAHIGSDYWYYVLSNPAEDADYIQYEYSELYEPSEISEKKCAEYYEESSFDTSFHETHPDKGKWRTPNQRELSIMLMNAAALRIDLADADGSHYSSVTTYNSRPYYYYNGGFTTTDGDLTGKQLKIRCVRDVE